MTAITITDLENAKLDVDHIAAIATSTGATATDRLGNVKPTIKGATDSLAADVAEVEARKVTALAIDIPAAIATVAAINNRGAWAATTAYALKDIALTSGTWYMCILAHTSSASFATDASSKWRVYQGITSGDLAAPTGAGLVGDRGTTVSNALALDKRKPRKVFSKLFAAASGPSAIRHIALGDSLASFKMQQLTGMLDRKIGGTSTAGVNTAGNTQQAGYSTAGNDLQPGAGTYATETTAYSYWITGQVYRVGAGGSIAFTLAGVTPTFTNARVYFVQEPGAGTINLIVNGATVATANASGAMGAGVLNFDQALLQQTVSVTVTGAPVRVIFGHIRNAAASGIDSYRQFSIGGLLLASGTTTQGLSIMAGVIANIAPDFLTFEMDDNFADAPNDAALASLASTLDTACPYADKLFIASTPRASGDAGKLASSNYLKGFCGLKNASYLFFDSYYLLGSYEEMVAIFGADDGTHPTPAAEAYAAEIMWDYLGLNSTTLGRAPRAINDPGNASVMGRNSEFVGGAEKLTIETDASFGYDWQIKYPRVLQLQTRGAYGTVSTVGWQFSGNVGVAPNVMPLAIDYLTAGGTRRKKLDSSSGHEFTVFEKTDNPSGRMNLLVGLIRSGHTRAELLAMNANALKGSMAWCTDCTGGAQWVYAKGATTSDWATVDGKAAI